MVALVKLSLNDVNERVVASFPHQMQSEHYGGNISVSIDFIALEHFIALPQTEIKSSTKPCPSHAVFPFFLSDDRKQYVATTNAHRKLLIGILKEQKVLTSTLSTIWENTDGCAEQYRCAFALYLISVLSQCYSIIID